LWFLGLYLVFITFALNDFSNYNDFCKNIWAKTSGKLNLSVIPMARVKILREFTGSVVFFLISVVFVEYLKWVMMK